MRTPSLPTTHTTRLARLADQFSELASLSLEPWLRVGFDPLGGALGFLDRKYQPVFDAEGAPAGPSGEVRGDQSLVQQSRHLYSYSLMAERRPREPRAHQAAHAMYAHLTQAFGADPALAYVHLRSRTGAVRTDAVQLYAQGFAVYALATYGRVFSVSGAIERARLLFEMLDNRRHDATFGGYEQADDGGWLPFVGAPPGAHKCTNTHIHILEAWTALCRALPSDSLVSSRLRELTVLIVSKLLQPSGYVHPFFASDWAPVGPLRVSYGHDIETSWLVLDALDALTASVSAQGGIHDAGAAEQVQTGARVMAEHALRTGWDEAGGLFDHGIPEGGLEPARVLAFEKIWWAQAEALPGIYRLYRQSGAPAQLAQLEQTLAFMRQRGWDAECGGYYCGVNSAGAPQGRGLHKGELWKTPYHDLRACLLTADWIRQDLERG